MRYTLRLLTLDQLARAAGLVCALELERWRHEEEVRDLAVRDWTVGRKGRDTNVMGRKGEKRSDSARAKVRQFKANPNGNPSPIPLEECPWCGTRFEPASFALLPNDDQPTELRIVCTNFECDFTGDRALPIVAVDDVIYRRLPAFLIATVDKFAALPWVGQAGLCWAVPTGITPAASMALRSRARETASSVARASRPHHPGRAAPHLWATRDDGRAVRDRDRGAVCQRRGRPSGSSQDRGLDGYGAAGSGPDPGAVRAAAHAGISAARTGSR